MRHWLITQWRIIKSGAINFIRNATLAVAAIAVMVITLTIVLTSIIANATFANTIKQITDKIDISVYLKDTISTQQKDTLLAQISKLPNVQSVKYISKDAALVQYKAQNQGNVDLLSAISQTDNPLPASITIHPRDPNRIQTIRDFLEKPQIRQLQSSETSYSGDRKQAIDKISSATKFFREAGLIGIAVFAVVSMLIIFNTIRMAIFNRRDELQIMRLLGASSWYIRGPFVVETVMYGIVSAIVSLTLCNVLFVVASSALGASSLGLLDIHFANTYFADHFWLFLASQITSGILIGAVSSVIATRRYLKFKTSK
ncbi:MAG: permease-like cell division protein FtsX [Candidatus Saccharimonadales bacterium]